MIMFLLGLFVGISLTLIAGLYLLWWGANRPLSRRP
jgi:hypothetical protein